MPTYRQWVSALSEVGLGSQSRVLVHASLETYHPDPGGPASLLGALTAVTEMVLTPGFTRRTLVTPRTGPPHNGLEYGEDPSNLDAELFYPDLRVDSELGVFAEFVRRHPEAERSSHPALSFCGIGASDAVALQTIDDPLAPIRWMAEADADVLLYGETHRRNVSLHYAERIAGRRTFVRWALTEDGVVTCPAFPGCSDGFDTIESRLAGIVRQAPIGRGVLTSIPMRDLLHTAVGWIREDPRALLCNRAGCARCAEIRAAVRAVADR